MILRTQTPKRPSSGIQSTAGGGGLRARLRSPAAMGVATVLAATPALAQDAEPATAAEAAQHTADNDPRQSEAGRRAAAAAASSRSTPAAATQRPAPTPSETAANEGEENLEGYALPTVHVSAEGDYKVDEVGMARLSTELVDTPQTVVVVPETLLKEQRAVTLQDALRNVSGITSNAGEGGRQGDSFLIRGFSAQNDMFRDGGRDNGWYTRDTFNVEAVEVFFGPSSVLFGRGATGGAINLVTKTPKATDFASVVLSAGTAPSGRAEVDVNHVVNDRVQVRANVAGQLASVPGRDVTRQDRLGVAPSLAIKLTDRTRLEFDHLYQREDGVPDYGQPWFEGQPVAVSADVPRNAFYGIRGQDTEQVDAHISTARLLHELGQDRRLTNTLRLARVARFARPTAPRGVTVVDDAPTTVGRQRFETTTDNDYVFDQLDLRYVFTTGILEHGLNVGLEGSYEHREQFRYNLRDAGGSNPVVDLYDPNLNPSVADYTSQFANASTTRQTTGGAYIADQIKITRFFELLGSARFDWFQTRYTRYGAESDASSQAWQKTDRMFNWRVGAVAHPVPGTSIYAMYGTSSNPSAELGSLSDGTITLDPERNTNLELGAKADLLEKRLGVAVALFRTEKLNGRLPNPDPSQPSDVLEGEQRVQGINVNASGQILRQWKVFANYTFLDSEIVNHTNDFIEGQPVPQTPAHSASLWTTVEPIDRLSLGLGATARSEIQVNNPADENAVASRIPGFVRLDFYAAYAFQAFDLQLNVNNLTNTLYYGAGYGGHAVPGEALSAMLTARFNF
ncbi:MAG TPA: TonB-dependent siderophore receptor [Myxococcaceae bacterium]|nr:TonB-dependent siderophore receptor [Myxococcaceae bacterium]